MKTKVYFAYVDALQDPALFSRGLQLLPWEERRQKALDYRCDADKRLSLGASLLLLYALTEAGVKDFDLSLGPYGKPYLTNRSDICFSLAHSGKAAVCAIGDSEIGIDVEYKRSAHLELARRVFSASEISVLRLAADPDDEFTRLWTRKESLLKLKGTGFALPQTEEASAVFSEMIVGDYRVCVATDT